MHPGHTMQIPAAFRAGTAFPIRGVIRRAWTIGAVQQERTVVAVTNTGVSGSVMTIIQLQTLSSVRSVKYTVVDTIPLLASAASTGGPTSARSMKYSLNVCNTTQALYRDGRVFSLVSSQRVVLPSAPSTMTAAQWDTFMDGLVAMPGAKPYAADVFSNGGRDFTGHIVDGSKYEEFGTFLGTDTLDNFWAHIAVWPSGPADGTAVLRPMSTTFIVIEAPSATAQQYEFSASAAYYTRWPLTSVPGQSQTEIPTADLGALNGLQKMAEAASNIAQNPLVGAAGDVLAKVAAMA